VLEENKLKHSQQDANYRTIDQYISELKELDTELQDQLATSIGKIFDTYGRNKNSKDLLSNLLKIPKNINELSKHVAVFNQSTKKQLNQSSLQLISTPLKKHDNMLTAYVDKWKRIFKE